MQNLVDSLQKENVKKAAVERSLASLVEKGTVTKKEYGKAKIFILAQDKLELPDPEEVTALEHEMQTLTTQLDEISQRVKLKHEKANALRQQYTLDDAMERDESLRQELQRKESKLKCLGDGSKLITKEDKAKIELNYYNLRSLWKKYKRTVTEITNQIGEAMGKKNAVLIEEIGIESDESVGVKIADFPEIANPLKPKRPAMHGRTIKRQRQK